MVKLSIIIPVYNGAKTINRCLNSIWDSGLDTNDYEVICVNDCSTDNTIEVLKREQSNHSNLRVISNKENLRAGGSRNHGVREAKGEYITFIDADDYYDNEGLYDAINYLKKCNNLDILMVGYSRETENAPSNKFVHVNKDESVMSGADFCIKNIVPWGPCQYVFKRKLMVDNDIYFVEKVQCEDVDWSYKLALSAKSIQFKPFLVSHSVLNDFSQTATTYKNYRQIEDTFFAAERLYDMYVQHLNNLGTAKILKSNSMVYYKEGIKGMIACKATIKQKQSTLKNRMGGGKQLSIKTLRLIQKHPLAFSIISNLIAPIIPAIIRAKRKYYGRWI